MKKQGAILLGIGGDNSVTGAGTFFEGVLTSGYPTNAVEDAVQANITAAGYAPVASQPGRQIVGSQSGRCVDAPAATNGTQVQLADCQSADRQRWTYTADKRLQVFGNKCLDANGQGTANGTQVIIWDCHGGANQQWNVNSNGTISGVQSGRCLDANAGGTANGTKLILWDCHGGTNQQWAMRG
jgi:non-reducing end alpha-L-arabinofuranosidase